MMSNPEPVIVYYKTQSCRYCRLLDREWGTETDTDNSTVLGAMKQVYSKFRTFVISSVGDYGIFDENIVPSDMRRYGRWFPMILLVPGWVWNNAMKTLGPGNPATIIDGVQIFNGAKGADGDLIYQRNYDREPEDFANWLTAALANEEFREHQWKYMNKPIRCNDFGAGLYRMFMNHEFTDVTIKLDDGSQIRTHKLVLAAASDYFKGQILRFPNPVISVDKVSSHTFHTYLILAYGQKITITDWRLAFELFDFIDYTKTLWPNKAKDVVATTVGHHEFLEYFDRVANLYDYEIPEEVIYDMAAHIQDLVDLSVLGEETMKILLNSEHLCYGITKQQLINHMRQLGVDAAMLDRLEVSE